MLGCYNFRHVVCPNQTKGGAGNRRDDITAFVDTPMNENEKQEKIDRVVRILSTL